MLAIIPARGGSKGLPGKNIKDLKGKPLIAYTIEAALASKYITRVIISTDDNEIAKIAVGYGAESPFIRPVELATDTARSIDVYKYTLGRMEQEHGDIINDFIVLQPTSPLRTTDDIDKAIELFRKKNADSVVSYCAEHHPIIWHKYIDKEGRFENIFETGINNRQDERISYYPNGAIYIFRRNMINNEQYYTDNSYAYLMDRKRSVDIDTIDDFEYVNFLIERDAV
jgi:N-acylneuraminate cytidylyltransferase/CMP-N,N'-diacetyllegionaminic acid synthase